MFRHTSHGVDLDQLKKAHGAELVAKVMGITPSTLAAICSGHRQLGSDKHHLLMERFPEYSAELTINNLSFKRHRNGKFGGSKGGV